MLTAVVLVAGCGGTPESPPDQPSTVDTPTTAAVPEPVPTTTTTSAAPAPPPVSIRAAVDAAENAIPSGMMLGLAVLNVGTGELVEGPGARRQFYSASLVKLIVAVDMFDRAAAEGLVISESDLRLVDRALRSSDDGAMNVLWGKFDGRGAVRRLADRIGLTMTASPGNPSEWGETLVTAADFVRIYQHILRHMAPSQRDLIVATLAGAQQRATDGFDQYFGLLRQGASPAVYAKQGWVSYRGGRFHLHSAGVVHDAARGADYAVALLSIQATGSAAARERLSTVAAAVTGGLVVS
ncbi:MAG TPA: serine hydrolase [Actinophytocola sp.]|uniref:serine hydrolase n=1 Tax=Actinophytocola sp. TaxID=1872138 RepID=UPI002DBF0DD9|nr:serine hydrolase [Actinophytocola sp.]HEU5472597.1 serine hydrolase [Actinophytocola sp.]